MTTLHIGKSRTETFSASDSSTPSGVTGVSQAPGLVTVSGATITGVAQGSTNVVWSASGYQPFTQNVVVTALPSLVVTDGPEVQVLATNVIRDARIEVLEHQVAMLTDAMQTMMESYKMLVSTLALASVGEQSGPPN